MSSFVFFHIILIIVFIVSLLCIVYNMLHINSIIGGLYILSKSVNIEYAKELVKQYRTSLYCLMLSFAILVISLFLIFSH